MNRIAGSAVAALAGLLLAGGTAAAAVDHDDPVPTVESTAETVLDLEGPVYELAYDAPRNAVWFAAISRGGQDRLWRIGLADRHTTSYPLPAVEYNGFTSHTRVAADGAVWVSLPYELVRVDPASGEVRSLPLDIAVPDALPAATDLTGPMPGTWITDVVTEGSSVVMSRLNVPYLITVDPALHPSNVERLPDGYAGSRSMTRGTDGWLYLLPGWDRVGPVLGIDKSGTARTVADVGASRLVNDHGAVVMLREGRGVGALSGGVAQIRTSITGKGSAQWTRSNARAGSIVEYDIDDGVLTFQGTGPGTKILQLDAVTGPAAGSKDLVTHREQVTDYVVADDGSVWLLRGNGAVLSRWAPDS